MNLTSRQIAQAALDLIDTFGSEALTMKQLATQLNRRPSSLYNHIAGKDDLIERMRALIVEDIDTSSFATEPWDDALVAWARSYLAAFAARPNTIRLLATTPITDLSTLRMYDVVISALIESGWADGEAVAVMRTVEALVLGSALDIIAPDSFLSADVVPPDLATLHRALDPAHAQTSSAEAAFELGLRALFDGLRANRAAHAEIS
ncbi:TetR/AcrR family transcriptional regulator C-terminal domain-containing protein [Glaciibacter psychrotolerans]|uniref:AcrR family transcriptional regulator n=1 Tax=Glaciibacter psychrotolerans TaxID=670054 RepID=A0A7Z0ECR1_9MICO|nr:TetR/AcrR family transcriptional regulator C-terminal domain-containing protein [Leifsonia psychrotolerans]NYJ19078.1 AcrR family transcriptional regulator [Leifsonia psychrotolerans]